MIILHYSGINNEKYIKQNSRNNFNSEIIKNISIIQERDSGAVSPNYTTHACVVASLTNIKIYRMINKIKTKAISAACSKNHHALNKESQVIVRMILLMLLLPMNHLSGDNALKMTVAVMR